MKITLDHMLKSILSNFYDGLKSKQKDAFKMLVCAPTGYTEMYFGWIYEIEDEREVN